MVTFINVNVERGAVQELLDSTVSSNRNEALEKLDIEKASKDPKVLAEFAAYANVNLNEAAALLRANPIEAERILSQVLARQGQGPDKSKYIPDELSAQRRGRGQYALGGVRVNSLDLTPSISTLDNSITASKEFTALTSLPQDVSYHKRITGVDGTPNSGSAWSATITSEIVFNSRFFTTPTLIVLPGPGSSCIVHVHQKGVYLNRSFVNNKYYNYTATTPGQDVSATVTSDDYENGYTFTSSSVVEGSVTWLVTRDSITELAGDYSSAFSNYYSTIQITTMPASTTLTATTPDNPSPGTPIIPSQGTVVNPLLDYGKVFTAIQYETLDNYLNLEQESNYSYTALNDTEAQTVVSRSGTFASYYATEISGDPVPMDNPLAAVGNGSYANLLTAGVYAAFVFPNANLNGFSVQDVQNAFFQDVRLPNESLVRVEVSEVEQRWDVYRQLVLTPLPSYTGLVRNRRGTVPANVFWVTWDWGNPLYCRQQLEDLGFSFSPP